MPSNSSRNASKPPVCDYCSGIGYIRYDVPIDDPRFGCLFPCQECNRDAIAKRAGLLPGELGISLSSINTRGRPGTAEMVAKANAFIENGFKGWLSLCGANGVGKSAVMKAIANAAIKRGIEVLYTTMTDVMNMAREAYESQRLGDTDYGRINRLARIRVLLVDEIDKARMTEYAYEVQVYLFDTRYRYSDVLGTVLAWNGGIEVIGEIMPSVASRISEFPVVINQDKDYRRIMAILRREGYHVNV